MCYFVDHDLAIHLGVYSSWIDITKRTTNEKKLDKQQMQTQFKEEIKEEESVRWIWIKSNDWRDVDYNCPKKEDFIKKGIGKSYYIL